MGRSQSLSPWRALSISISALLLLRAPAIVTAAEADHQAPGQPNVANTTTTTSTTATPSPTPTTTTTTAAGHTTSPAASSPPTTTRHPSHTTATPEPTCESRTANYITHTLPQQCLTARPTSAPAPSAAPETVTVTATAPAAGAATPGADGSADAESDLDADGNDLSTGAFMSFEEWKAMMLAKAGQDELENKPRRQPGDIHPGDDFATLGDEGEIDFDVYSDRISEITSGGRPSPSRQHPHDRADAKDQQVEKVPYDEALATTYRSKDAGKTCKERFSYSSFDAGATVLKTSPGAKNPSAILVENKDSYMLLECATPNKFFIVELSDDILVDTVVLANYEFFSSMIRQFRVSVSDRWPVKSDKWKDLGTFEARNSRDIQAFLVQNPQIWARYIRIEFLSHFGNEYYCPLSLLRIHGTRMLDSWKEADPSDLEGDEDEPEAEQAPPEVEHQGEAPEEEEKQQHDEQPVPADNETRLVEMETSEWLRYWDASYFEVMYPRDSFPATDSPVSDTHAMESEQRNDGEPAKPRPAKTAEQTSNVATPASPPAEAAPTSTTAAQTTGDQPAADSSSVGGASTASPSSYDTPTAPAAPNTEASAAGVSTSTPVSANATQTSTTTSFIKPTSIQPPPRPARTSASTSIKPPSKSTVPNSNNSNSNNKPATSGGSTGGGSAGSGGSAGGGSATVPRNSNGNANKTATATASSGPASPTVQDSFFKALTKRLSNLESNTTLSLQYIESQSKFLQEALARLEKRQVAKVDLFLETLNRTVLGELRDVRAQYDQIWQSTVIALDTQRDQSERELVALGERLALLADEVVFQKRMAIAQSALLLICLVLVIFSRAGGSSGAGTAAAIANAATGNLFDSSAAGAAAYYHRLASGHYPSTPKDTSPPPLVPPKDPGSGSNSGGAGSNRGAGSGPKSASTSTSLLSPVEESDVGSPTSPTAPRRSSSSGSSNNNKNNTKKGSYRRRGASPLSAEHGRADDPGDSPGPDHRQQEREQPLSPSPSPSPAQAVGPPQRPMPPARAVSEAEGIVLLQQQKQDDGSSLPPDHPEAGAAGRPGDGLLIGDEDDEDLAYDSEPTTSASADFFSSPPRPGPDEDEHHGGAGATNGNGGPSPAIISASPAARSAAEVSAYGELLAHKAAGQQLTPPLENGHDDHTALSSTMRTARGPGPLSRSGSTRKPLPALPEDPD